MFICVGFFLFTIYIFSLIFLICGIFKIFYQNNNSDIIHNISIVVCVRNGALSLSNILLDLQKQSYPGNLEFIIVDDESTDQSKNIIHQFLENDQKLKTLLS